MQYLLYTQNPNFRVYNNYLLILKEVLMNPKQEFKCQFFFDIWTFVAVADE